MGAALGVVNLPAAPHGALMDTDSILDEAVVLSRAPQCEEYSAIVRATATQGGSAAATGGDRCAAKLASVLLSAYAKSYDVEDEAAHSVRAATVSAAGFWAVSVRATCVCGLPLASQRWDWPGGRAQAASARAVDAWRCVLFPS